MAPDENLLARLERRLHRERVVRQEAERLAEHGTRQLYEQARHLGLLETIAAMANSSGALDKILRQALAEVCAFTGWPIGHALWAVKRGGATVLTSSGLWHTAQGLAVDGFRRTSEAMEFGVGHGLPGQVMATGAAAWIDGIDRDPNFPRSPVAAACGLNAAFAFPVLVDLKTVAVLEFFSPKSLPPDEALLRTIRQVAGHLGRVLERSRSEQRLKIRNVRLRRLIKQADAQRQAANAASLAKSAFLAVTSHEVRTPLNAVLGLAEALRREPLSDRQADLVKGILDSGKMLMRLLDAVLDLSKIEAGQAQLHPVAFGLRQATETIVRVWLPRFAAEGLTLQLDLDGLPGSGEILSDARRYEQTLVNLISNAMKFSPPGSRVLVRVGAVQAGSKLKVLAEVLDQGSGISESDRQRIFDPYEQTAAGRATGGAGLGLSICTGNIALLGGQIGVDDAQGGGSRFWFGFAVDPIAEPLKCEAATQSKPDLDQPSNLGPSFQVLAAEDNAANRRVLELLLQPLEVSLTFAFDGKEALAAVQVASFDVILMDANMPHMDGVTAVRHIRSLCEPAASLPIYMLTANVFEEDVARYYAAGVTGVLRKPIDVPELYAALEAVALQAERVAAA